MKSGSVVLVTVLVIIGDQQLLKRSAYAVLRQSILDANPVRKKASYCGYSVSDTE